MSEPTQDELALRRERQAGNAYKAKHSGRQETLDESIDEVIQRHPSYVAKHGKKK